MKNVRIIFEPYEGNVEELPPGYQEVSCNIICDVNMGENLRLKVQEVEGGHKTKTPSYLNYFSVAPRDSVRAALTIAALNDLKVLA